MESVDTSSFLLNAEIGGEEEVLRQLKTIDGVDESYVVYGVNDLVCRVKAPDMDSLKDVITSAIRGLDNVRSTLTMIAVEGPEK